MFERYEPIEIDVGNKVSVVAFSANGEHLMSGGEEVHVWRVEDGRQVARMETDWRAAPCLAVSQDGKWIAAGTAGSDVFVWNAETYEQVFKHKGDGFQRVSCVDFSPDSARLVSASNDRTATIFDLVTRRQVQTLEHRHGVIAAKYSLRGDRIATATLHLVYVWDSRDGCLLLNAPVGVASPSYNKGLLWSDSHLFVVSQERIKELDARTGSIVSEWPVSHTGHLLRIALSEHGTLIAYATGRTVTILGMSTHVQLGQIYHTQDVCSIAFSPDDQFLAIGGKHGKLIIATLSHITHPIPLSHLHPTLREPAIHVDTAGLDLWKHDQLEDVDTLLTIAISESQNQSHEMLASRALVRTRLQQWDAALVDAEKAIKIRPSVIGYIAKSIAHVGNGERHKGYRACDIAFERFHSSHVTFLLLIKAIIVFMAGEHADAISRMDDLIAMVPFNSICYVVQAYMYLLHGNLHMQSCNYVDAIYSFEHGRAQLRPHASQSLFVISLISGWKFEELDIMVRQRLCEALYSAGRINDAGDSLLELVHALEQKANTWEVIGKWVSDFTQRCLSTSEVDGDTASVRRTNVRMLYAKPTPLLLEWAKRALADQYWKDVLSSAAVFIVPRFTIYRALCECLEAIDYITDATECILEMASELVKVADSEQAKWLIDLKDWCGGKLKKLGDDAMSTRRSNEAVIQYSVALSLNPTNPQSLFVQRSKAQADMGLWTYALDDANRVIMLDPSSPLGYERKYAALHGAGCYGDAKVAFEIMLSKMSESADPEVRERSHQYVKPAQTEAVIRGAVENAIRKSPLVLINTDSGRLLDKTSQASSFESQPVFHELVTSMTTGIDHTRIEYEVGQYYRYATFSHKWKSNEPLFDKAVHIVVYELEDSPTHIKLQMFCKIVRDAGLHWAWSDTCCINKADPSVLQEALVSMFQWYQSSTMTVVLLCDVPFRRLMDSIWNSRAWTLQEYHASKVIRFYNKDWPLYRNLDVPNHKESPEIIAEMEEATGVSARALMALQPGLEDIREKLRLASTRQTTRIEDSAYSLLGIFNLSMPVVYGEGDKALGRLLAQLLTSSGDTSILAWTGRSGSFNSCLPENVSVFSQLSTSHIPPAITSAEMETISARLRLTSLDPTLVTRLYDRLNELPVPSFNGKRMKLPSVIFKLGPLSVSRGKLEQVFRAQTDALGIVEINTEEDLSRFKPLYLVHPWIDFLVDRQPVGSVEAIPEETTGDQYSFIGDSPSFSRPSNTASVAPQTRTSLTSRFGLPFGRRPATRPEDTASLLPPSTLGQIDKQMDAFRVLARLRQPFGALLLTPDPGNVAAYRRVAAETLITVQVEEITPTILDRLIGSVRVLDVL